MRHIGDEIAAHRLEAPQIGNVAEHEQRPAVREHAAGDEEGVTAERQLSALHVTAGGDVPDDLPGRLVVKQLAERRQGSARRQPQQAAGGGVARDDLPAGVGGDQTVGERGHERRHFPLTPTQLGEPRFQLGVHPSQRRGVIGDLRDPNIRE